MLTNVWDFLRQFWNSVALWVVVCPWERAIRVRMGRHVTTLEPGFCLKVPLLDEVYKQTVRRRVCSLSPQLLSTRDGRAVHVAAALGYEITDLLRLYQTLHHAEDTLRNLASAAIATLVVATEGHPGMPAQIEAAVPGMMRLDSFGVGNVTLQVTDFAFVKTLRVVTDQKWGGSGDMLTTTQPMVGPR